MAAATPGSGAVAHRKRALPTQELLAMMPSYPPLRRLRMAYLRRHLGSCGEGVRISQGVVLEMLANLHLGSHVFINRGTVISARARITIGDDVLIGPHVGIHSSDHGYEDAAIPIRCQPHRSSPIVVGDDVWIGGHATVLRGVTIGRGSVVAAGAVVNRDVPEGVLVAGVPARVVRAIRHSDGDNRPVPTAREGGSMAGPTHADGMIFMEYYKLWDTPFDNQAWTAVRRLRAEGAFDSYERFRELVPRTSADFGLVDRVFCSFGQAGVLMKYGLLHPDLYFEGWANVVNVWRSAEAVVRGMREEANAPYLYETFEWLAERNAQWKEERARLEPG